MNDEFRKASHMRTICEVLREIYEATSLERVRALADEAIVMAKKMDEKLREYRTDWNVGIFEENENVHADRLRRAAV